MVSIRRRSRFCFWPHLRLRRRKRRSCGRCCRTPSLRLRCLWRNRPRQRSRHNPPAPRCRCRMLPLRPCLLRLRIGCANSFHKIFLYLFLFPHTYFLLYLIINNSTAYLSNSLAYAISHLSVSKNPKSIPPTPAKRLQILYIIYSLLIFCGTPRFYWL